MYQQSAWNDIWCSNKWGESMLHNSCKCATQEKHKRLSLLIGANTLLRYYVTLISAFFQTKCHFKCSDRRVVDTSIALEGTTTQNLRINGRKTKSLQYYNLNNGIAAQTCKTSYRETWKCSFNKIIEGKISGSLDNSLQCVFCVWVMHHVFPTIINISAAMA